MNKTIKLLVLILTFCLFITSCNRPKDEPSIMIGSSNINLVVGDSHEVVYDVFDSKDNEVEFEISNPSIAKMEGNKVIALKKGSTNLKIVLKSNPDVFVSITIFVSDKPSISLSGKTSLIVGEKTSLEPVLVNLSGEITWYSSNPLVLTVDDEGKITALGKGESTITATIGKYQADVTITVEYAPAVIINGNESMYVGSQLELMATLINLDGIIEWSSSNNEIAEVDENGIVTALTPGTVTIYAKVGEYEDSITITVEEVPTITINGNESMYVGSQLELTTTLINLDGIIEWSSSNSEIAEVDEKGIVTALTSGNVTIYAKIGQYEDSITITVEVPDTTNPVLAFDGVTQYDYLNWNAQFDPLKGIVANDNIDGDITSKIKVEGSVDNQEYGKHTLVYSVTDNAGNTATLERVIEVIWNYDVKFIGHGGSYYGIMNSEEAILYAATVLKYQAIEVDLKQSSDGVFILCHDDTFAGYSLASTPWSTLKNVEYTSSRKAGIPGQNGSVVKDTYTTKLCTLERYLEICKEYNIIPVIELKSSNGITNSSQTRMQALMNEIEKAGMIDKVVLLGSQYNCLIWTRNNGYNNVECQYLVNSCESETILQRCIDYNFDISINVTGSYTNSLEWLARYKEAGCKISTYTFTQWVDYDVVQEWIDNGVDFVTCDWQLMSKLDLPVSSTIATKHKVVFKDNDGTILKETEVADGKIAPAPMAPTKEGYEFVGWDKNLRNIKEDTTFTAMYKLITYTITYVANNTKITESNWSSKEEFTTEFYNDLYSWFTANGKNLSFVTENNGTFTFTKNGKTVTFASADDIKALTAADFELTISNIIYRPVTRASDDTCVILADENYFLNSDLYRVKYQGVDAWLIYCLNNTSNYAHYDKTYTPTSAGKIQILFRFHQWATKGTNIPNFNNIPSKYIEEKNTSINEVMPTTPLTYTIEDEIKLPNATGDVEFLGWFLDKECTIAITKIEKGSTGNLVLYAKWNIL